MRPAFPRFFLVLLLPALAGCADPGPNGPVVVASPKVVLLDGAANEVVAVDLPDMRERQRELVGLGPVALALDPSARHLLVTNAGSNTVGLRNATTLGALDSYVVAEELGVERNRPRLALPTPDGKELWVALPEAHKIARFGFRTRDPLPAVALPFAPGAFAFTDAGEAWVAEDDGPRIAVLEANRTVAAVLDVGTSFQDVDARQHLVFAVDREEGLFIFYAENRTVRAELPLEGYVALAMSGDGSAIALAGPDADRVLLLDGPRQVEREITVSGGPHALAFWDERGWLVIGTEGGRVVVADADGRVLRERRIGGAFTDAVVLP